MPANPNKALFDATISGNLSAVTKALNDGGDPNWLNPKDEMASLPLHYAAGQGYEDVVQLLVERKADPNVRNIHRYTPLHNAARKGYGAVAQILIASRADVAAEAPYLSQSIPHSSLHSLSERNDGKSPSQVAQESGHSSMASLFAKKSEAATVELVDGHDQKSSVNLKPFGLHSAKAQSKAKPKSVEELLNSLNLQKYLPNFEAEEVVLENFPHLRREDLKEIGLPLGPRTTIWAYFNVEQ